jgi:wyosine [tRNA(Phe)-imidazoG37] synthetase (radical SAM superfamily)
MKMHLAEQLLFPIKDERLKTSDRIQSMPVYIRVRVCKNVCVYCVMAINGMCT